MNLDYSFTENLRAMATPRVLRQHMLKIEIAVTTENQWRILAWLNRLNVNRLSLFPGIDGFASSLQGMVSWMRWPPSDWRQRRAAEARGKQPQ
jgi:hypothetical protein